MPKQQTTITKTKYQKSKTKYKLPKNKKKQKKQTSIQVKKQNKATTKNKQKTNKTKQKTRHEHHYNDTVYKKKNKMGKYVWQKLWTPQRGTHTRIG